MGLVCWSVCVVRCGVFARCCELLGVCVCWCCVVFALYCIVVLSCGVCCVLRIVRDLLFVRCSWFIDCWLAFVVYWLSLGACCVLCNRWSFVGCCSYVLFWLLLCVVLCCVLCMLWFVLRGVLWHVVCVCVLRVCFVCRLVCVAWCVCVVGVVCCGLFGVLVIRFCVDCV